MKKQLICVILLLSLSVRTMAQETAQECYEYFKLCYSRYLETGEVSFFDRGFGALDRAVELQSDSAMVSMGMLFENAGDYKNAMRLYFKAKAYKNDMAMHQLGLLYYEGLGCESNDYDAFYWFNKAAKRGNMASAAILSDMYLFGTYHILADKNKALYWAEKSAQANDSYGLYMLGKCYFILKPGEKEGLYCLYYSRSACMGNGFAKETLGEIERDFVFKKIVEYGTTKDIMAEGKRLFSNSEYNSSIPYLRLAASREVPDAYYYLGNCYNYGRGVKVDLDSARYFYQKAIGMGFAEAEAALNYIDNHGPIYDAAKDTVAASYVKAALECSARGDTAAMLANLKHSIYEGSIIANTHLGLYYMGLSNSFPDQKKSFNLFKTAARYGEPLAQYYLGVHYQYGLGTEPDNGKAVEYYYKSLDQGCMEAVSRLAACIKDGVGISKNVNQALSMMKFAAASGDTAAMITIADTYIENKNYNVGLEIYQGLAGCGYLPALYRIALCYFDGLGVSKDLDKSFELTQKASECGKPEIIHHLAICYWNGFGTKKDRKKAFSCFQKAAQAGYVDSMIELSFCYENGRGVAKDKKMAEFWQKKAESTNSVLTK